MNHATLKRSLVALSLILSAGSAAHAGTLLKPGGNWPGGSEFAMTGNVKVRSYAPSSATTSDVAGFSAALQKQNFTQDPEGTGVLTGDLRLDQNTAWAINEPAQNFYGYNFPAANHPNTVGNAFAVGYVPMGNDPAAADARWLQVIRTNSPLAWGQTNGTQIPGDNGFTWYIDNGWTGNTAGADPFYGADDNTNNTGYAANGQGLIDSPSRPAAGGIVWEAWAFISTRSNGALTIYDGVHWGWETTVVPAPGSLALASLGGILALRRRRN
ncbi:MAG: hypothetical protein GC200_07920 [Tepidisphaera sp.]|nr:hypothetical protein [Tepidisphaera sp.]